MPYPGDGYRGELTVEQAWETFRSDAGAMLIDVRTQAEWAYAGVPSLDTIGKSQIFFEWQTLPTSAKIPNFATLLGAELQQRSVAEDTPPLFICRSGARSRSAAIAMTSAGYANCYNIGTSFEGPLDGDRHCGSVSGWRLAGLP